MVGMVFPNVLKTISKVSIRWIRRNMSRQRTHIMSVAKARLWSCPTTTPPGPSSTATIR